MPLTKLSALRRASSHRLLSSVQDKVGQGPPKSLPSVPSVLSTFEFPVGMQPPTFPSPWEGCWTSPMAVMYFCGGGFLWVADTWTELSSCCLKTFRPSSVQTW